MNTKTSLGDQDDIFTVQDKDLIGTDDRGTSTEDIEIHIGKHYGFMHKEREVQTERGVGAVDVALESIDMYDMGQMQDQHTETN